MAAEVARREQTLQSINDVSALYDEYFVSIPQDLEELGDQNLLKVAGLVSFFRIVDRSNKEMMGAIHEAFKVPPDTFWEAKHHLILRGKIRVSDKARRKFKDRVRQLTRRHNPLSTSQVIQELNAYLRGWVSYFGIQEFKEIFGELYGWIRSRLRSMQLKKWKKPQKFQRIMIKVGFKPKEAQRVWVRMNKWQSVERKEVRFIINLEWFRRQGLIFLNDFTQKTLKPGFSR